MLGTPAGGPKRRCSQDRNGVFALGTVAVIVTWTSPVTLSSAPRVESRAFPSPARRAGARASDIQYVDEGRIFDRRVSGSSVLVVSNTSDTRLLNRESIPSRTTNSVRRPGTGAATFILVSEACSAAFFCMVGLNLPIKRCRSRNRVLSGRRRHALLYTTSRCSAEHEDQTGGHRRSTRSLPTVQTI